MLTYLKNASRVAILFLLIAISLSGNVGTTLGSSVAYAQAEISSTPLPSEWQNYVDSEYGFQVGYPVHGWTGAVAFQNDTQADDVVVKRFTIRNEEFAFINIDVWNNSAGLTIPDWIEQYQKGLLDSTVTIPTTSNITISGIEGFFIIQPPNLENQIPGRIMAVAANNGFIYLIEYIAQDGGAAQDVYISVLETFEFESGDVQPDNLPKAPFFDIDDVQAQEQREFIEVFATASFSKREPVNGATVNPSSVTLKWNAASPSPIKYRYAVNTSPTTTDWTSVYGSTEVTVSYLLANQRYYWQVQAVYCDTCVPKEVVSANNGDWWSFTTINATVTISGNTGLSGTTLSYTGGTSAVTADINGNYSITVPYGWSGTVVPSKAGYSFSPPSRTYSFVQTNLTAQNYAPLLTISGNVGVSDTLLNYVDGTPKTVVAVPNGNYSLTVPPNWSGRVIPSHACYTFVPTSHSYSNVLTNLMGQDYTPAFNPVSGCADINISVAGAIQGRSGLHAGTSIHQNYAGTMGGPVKVTSATGERIFTSQRVIYGNSFNELMGYPVDQFTTEYWFPWYDQVYMNTWILVGNPSSTQTAYVDIYIGGVKRDSYSIPPGDRVLPQFPGVLDGPVRVVSISGTGTPTPLPIFASERSTYLSSFNEVMGYPMNQFTTEYWFPWYDQIYMNTWILVGNPSSTQTAYVDIYIGGIKRNTTPYAIPPNGRVLPQFPGVLDGPVRVVSTTGAGTPTAIPVFASQRSTYQGSFNEVMGYPANKFTTEYWYPWYDKVYMNTWVLVGNPSSTQTAYVDIYIDGIKRNATPYAIPANGRVMPQFELNTGPVRVVSVTGAGTPTAIPIFTSERSLYGSSFNEVMGYPANQLSSEYWFPWYDSVYMTSHLLVGRP